MRTAERTGIFTSGIVATHAGQQIALFFTGVRHAGENLAAVLARRNMDLPAPIQMCDGLSRNIPSEFDTILSQCLAQYPESGFILLTNMIRLQ
jgi:transposase